MVAKQKMCPNGHPMDASWDVCPYCHGSGGQSKPPAAAHAGVPKNVPVSDKTQAIEIPDEGEEFVVVGWIVALNGSHRGHDFRIKPGKNVIGTAADCDIVITDPYLSSKHAMIKYENNEFLLVDLDSTNGTFTNERRITKEELIDNDKIRLGRTEFRFKSLF